MNNLSKTAILIALLVSPSLINAKPSRTTLAVRGISKILLSLPAFFYSYGLIKAYSPTQKKIDHLENKGVDIVVISTAEQTGEISDRQKQAIAKTRIQEMKVNLAQTRFKFAYALAAGMYIASTGINDLKQAIYYQEEHDPSNT